jgi:hypothetical protein
MALSKRFPRDIAELHVPLLGFTQDPTDWVFVTDDEPAPRSFHDPRFYEDLR